MKMRFFKIQSYLMGLLLGALGFGGCRTAHNVAAKQPADGSAAPTKGGRVVVLPPEPDTIVVRPPEPREPIALMYGVPTMNFRVRGQVLAKGKPVRDIQVLVLDEGIEATPDTIYGPPDRVSRYVESQAVRTLPDGTFEVSGQGRPLPTVRLLVRDTDGSNNGSYKNQLLEVPTHSDEEVIINLERK
ncbi:MAG: radical SAM-associated putative lipoprotein [Bacteroidales bacterium]|nr:radical SAM-associated putative lipoprotein [Bacteroidales bacterium]